MTDSPTPEPEDVNAGGPWSMASEAGRLGVSLAGRIAHEFSRLVPSQLIGQAAGGEIPTGSDDFRRAMRTTRLDVERALDGVMAVLGEALDSYSELAEGAVAAANESSAPNVETLVVRTSPGASATTELWIHNTTDRAAPAAAAHVTPLVAQDRTMLLANVCFDPPLVGPVEAGASASLVMRVETDDSATAGTYHGVVLADGLDDVALHLRVVIASADPESD